MKEKVVEKIEMIKNKSNDFFNNNKYLLKPFLILLIIYLLAFYPLARANINYTDDVGRVHSGYIEWDYFSRYISKYFAIFMHTGTYLADISPLPQIVALVFLSISGCILISLFNENKKVSLINIISVIPIGLSPYYLECISYKYDAPYMALSVLACFVPFIFFKKGKANYIKFFVANIIGTLVMCMTYQASSGIVPMITIFLAFNLWSKKDAKEAMKLIALSAGSYIIGLIIFKLLILHPVDTYVNTSMLPLKELIPGFINNIKKYYGTINRTLRNLWKVLIYAIILLFIITKTIESKQNKILSAIIVVLTVFISGIVAFGVLPTLRNTLFAARSVYGIGILIALLAVNITIDKKYIINHFIIFILCWCFFTFSFLYGNAYAEQKRYENFRIQMVIDDLNNLEMMNTDEIKKINVKGNIGKAPSIDNYPSGYLNMINFLITQSFSGNGKYAYMYFANFFKLKNVEVVGNRNTDGIEFNYVKDTMYYQIWTNSKDYILLILE